MARGENKKNMTKVGLKVYGHRSHVSGGRFNRVLAGKGYFEKLEELEQERYLTK